MLYNLLDPNCISKTRFFFFLFNDHQLESQHPRVGSRKHLQNVARIKTLIAHLMESLQITRMLIEGCISQIPFRCNIHSKLQT